MQRAKTIVLLVGVIALAANIATFAQQHDHAEHQNPVQWSPSADDDVAIFCPTMKTGQLCSHGTSNVLQLTGEKQQKWIAFAQKYNRAVNAATLQLFKDSEGCTDAEGTGTSQSMVRRRAESGDQRTALQQRPGAAEKVKRRWARSRGLHARVQDQAENCFWN